MCDNHKGIVILNIQIILTKNRNVPYVMYQEGKIKKLYFYTKMFRILYNSLVYFSKPLLLN